MRISDNPNIGSADLDSNDILLLTHTPNGTGTNDNKDKKLTLSNLSNWTASNIKTDVKNISTSLDISNLSANAYKPRIYFLDKNSVDLGHIGGYALTTGVRGLQIEAYRILSDDSKKGNTIYLGLDAEGNALVNISGTGAAAAWRTAIGAVPTSRTVNGHALSGNVTITASDLGLANSVTHNAIAAKPVDSGTNTNLGNTGSLAAGAYIIIGEAYIGSSDNSTGRRSLWFSDTSGGATPVNEAQNTVPGTQGGKMQVVLVVSHTKATTYHLNYYQNSTAAKNVSGSITILKIHG